MAPAEEMPDLEPLLGQFAEAFNRKDTDALVAMFAEQGSVMPPGLRTITGRESIGNFWRSTVERASELSLTSRSLKPLGPDVARQQGRIGMKLGEGAQDLTGKFLLLWEKSADGWVIESMIWNRVRTPNQGRARQGQGGGRARQPATAARGGAYGQVSNLY